MFVEGEKILCFKFCLKMIQLNSFLGAILGCVNVARVGAVLDRGLTTEPQDLPGPSWDSECSAVAEARPEQCSHKGQKCSGFAEDRRGLGEQECSSLRVSPPAATCLLQL